jgi:hypothetical protein
MWLEILMGGGYLEELGEYDIKVHLCLGFIN